MLFRSGKQMANVAVSWNGPKDESSLQILGTNGMLFAMGSSGKIQVSVGGKQREEICDAPWGQVDRSHQAMISEFVNRCLQKLAFNEFEIRTWDSGTRWILEAYKSCGV